MSSWTFLGWALLIPVFALVLGASASSGVQPAAPPPIIDMHLHAENVADYGPTPAVCSDNRTLVFTGWDGRKPFSFSDSFECGAPLWRAPATDAALLQATLGVLERYNIRAVTSGSLENVTRWRSAAPNRIIPAVSFFNGNDAQGRPIYREVAELRQLVTEGRVSIFAEVGAQYRGMSPADPALAGHFALAEELDVPVGLHLGEGPIGGPNVPGYSGYRVRAGSPLLLEDVLVRHPKLRIYVMHFGSPLVDEMIALLFSYPQVYVDIAGNNWGFPRRHFHAQLQRLVDAGFGKRILFGSDQMVWPQTIGLAIETVESADFLTAGQKRDIFHDNAARFLRLTPREAKQRH